MEPPHGPVERDFLRPVVLGETILPFRLLEPSLAVLPLESAVLLDSNTALEAGHRLLAGWLRDIEAKWIAHSSKDPAGRNRMTLSQRINHMHGLTTPAVVSALKVVYSASGKLLSAALVNDSRVVVEHAAYWSAVRSEMEAGYLLAILNSAAIVNFVSTHQPRGEFNPRHFDKLVWGLPIPEFDPESGLHQKLATAAEAAEQVAKSVSLPNAHFTAKRRAIRQALTEHGIAKEIEALVAELLS